MSPLDRLAQIENWIAVLRGRSGGVSLPNQFFFEAVALDNFTATTFPGIIVAAAIVTPKASGVFTVNAPFFATVGSPDHFGLFFGKQTGAGVSVSGGTILNGARYRAGSPVVVSAYEPP